MGGVGDVVGRRWYYELFEGVGKYCIRDTVRRAVDTAVVGMGTAEDTDAADVGRQREEAEDIREQEPAGEWDTGGESAWAGEAFGSERACTGVADARAAAVAAAAAGEAGYWAGPLPVDASGEESAAETQLGASPGDSAQMEPADGSLEHRDASPPRSAWPSAPPWPSRWPCGAAPWNAACRPACP